MLLRIGLRQKLAARISRLIPTQATALCTQHDETKSQGLYESIAVGNALAEIEDNASRYWRGN